MISLISKEEIPASFQFFGNTVYPNLVSAVDSIVIEEEVIGLGDGRPSRCSRRVSVLDP